MTTAQQCVRCGAGRATDAPGGLCPSCLGQLETTSRTNPELPGVTGPFPGPVTPPPAELAEHFPSLEILGLLGQGGMGTVYKVRQLKLDRLVALKVLSVRSASPAFAVRFLREARALARLNHPHVVTVHDFGEAGPFYYFLMELVEGGSLRDLLRAGRRPPGEVLPLIVQACDALQYAHDEGIIHRDVKPDNLLLDRRGRVKVADFGLARLLGPAPAFTLTGSQQAMGTLHYVAPEQWETAHSVDHRADVYSLGVVFYELLLGELPLGRFPLPSQKGVDPRLDDVVLRTLEKDPHKRYQRAADLKADVEAILNGSPAVVAAPSRSDTLPLAPPAARRPATQALDVSREGLELAGREVSGPASALLLAGVLTVLQPVELALLFGFTWLGAVTLLGIPFGVVMALAAHRMRRLEAAEFALLGGILALIPLGPAWAVGLPAGIWVLLVLRKPEVRAAFAIPKPAGPALAWPRWLYWSPARGTITLCVLGLLTTALPWATQVMRHQNVSHESAPPGFLTWPGLAVALLFLLLGTTLLLAQRTWTHAVRRWVIFLRFCLTLLLALAGLGMLLFFVLLLVVVGLPAGRSDPGTYLAAAWLAFAVLLMATWFVRGRNWRPVTTIQTGLAIVAVVGLLILQAETVGIKNVFIVPFAQTGDQPVGPPRTTFVPLLALALAAGLVLLGGGWLFWVTRVRRSVPIPANEEDRAT